MFHYTGYIVSNIDYDSPNLMSGLSEGHESIHKLINGNFDISRYIMKAKYNILIISTKRGYNTKFPTTFLMNLVPETSVWHTKFKSK